MGRGGGGRDAEHVGRRTSSCIFADNIAKASIAAYDAALASVPEPTRTDAFGGGKQTVLAAVVARDERMDALRVVALGTGTKFMSAVDIEADADAGARVRDSHAEVLARRGLRRFLYAQLALASKRSAGPSTGISRKRTRDDDDTGDGVTTESARGEGDDAGPGPGSNPGSIHGRGAHSTNYFDDANWSVLERDGDGYRVRPSVTFHMYTSSTPCGNAAIKRWAKGAKEKFTDGLGPFQTPPGSEEHGSPSWSAVKEGQIAFLYKRDPGSCVSPDGDTRGATELTGATDTTTTNATTGSMNAVPCECVPPSFIPPGTWTSGRVLTCSDKLAVWSCVGVQGAALMSRGMLTTPVYLASVTVGRKFNQAILRRALCCRMHRFESERETCTKGGTGFEVRHPSVMCTAVPFDLGTYAEGEGAVFDRREALAWWLETNETRAGDETCAGDETQTHEDSLKVDDETLSGDDDLGVGENVRERGRGMWEVLDGRAGLRLLNKNSGCAPGVSALSRAGLLGAHLQAAGGATGGVTTYGDVKRSARDASGYGAAKRRAMSQPGLWALSRRLGG
jgi:hypothetical protein